MCQEKQKIADPSVIKAVGIYGGGIAGSGSVCGVLLAGVTMISSMYSRSSLNEKENPRMWSLSQEFINEFERITQIHGGTNCRDIARVNWHDRKEVKDFYFNPDGRRQDCIKLVGDIAYFLGKIIEQEANIDCNK